MLDYLLQDSTRVRSLIPQWDSVFSVNLPSHLLGVVPFLFGATCQLVPVDGIPNLFAFLLVAPKDIVLSSIHSHQERIARAIRRRSFRGGSSSLTRRVWDLLLPSLDPLGIGSCAARP